MMLYALLFLWQLPHFTAIAWMYRDDYARAGYLVLPIGKRKGRVMIWQSLLPIVVLMPVCLIPMLRSHAGLIYPVSALALSWCFFYFGADLALRRSNTAARRLMLASIIPPCVFFLMVLNQLLSLRGTESTMSPVARACYSPLGPSPTGQPDAVFISVSHP
jgi:protoheme IX farnesyltransferase